MVHTTQHGLANRLALVYLHSLHQHPSAPPPLLVGAPAFSDGCSAMDHFTIIHHQYSKQFIFMSHHQSIIVPVNNMVTFKICRNNWRLFSPACIYKICHWKITIFFNFQEMLSGWQSNFDDWRKGTCWDQVVSTKWRPGYLCLYFSLWLLSVLHNEAWLGQLGSRLPPLGQSNSVGKESQFSSNVKCEICQWENSP